MSGGIGMASLVYLKHKNGTTYVYENVSFWDKKSKKPKSKRKCIGHLDPETGTVQPNGMRGGNRRNAETKPEKDLPNALLTAVAYPTSWIKYVRISDSAIS